MFKPVPNQVNFVAQEHEMLDFWVKSDAFGKLNRLRRDSPRWSFIDGPITANNPMGAHHAWGRTYKDLFQRFKAMQGHQTRYQNGFDCQGLWVEVEVEKTLGFKTKRDIEAYGMARFVNACKQRVLRYAAVQTEQSIRLGYWMDWNDPERLRWLEQKLAEDPMQIITVEGPEGPVTDTVEQIVGRLGLPELGGSYFTFSNENNYTIWAMLRKCFDRGWIYKGTDVMPWCARCGTGISQHEIVTEGYQELTHTSVFLRFPLRERPGESLLVWTTTPWTLTSNVAAAVHPDLPYVLVEQQVAPSGAEGVQRLWLSKGALDNAIRGKYTVLDEKPGTALQGWTYDGPFDDLPAEQNLGAVAAHRVILWDEVGEAEGTGIVHIAPGCGAEDFALSKLHGLPVVAPLDESGIYLPGFDWLSGRSTHEVAPLIFDNLRDKGLLYRLEDYTHRYPVCWRCASELVFRLVEEWFISMGEQLDKPYEQVTEEEKQRNLRYQMMEVVIEGTRWYPSFGFERELDWLRNMHDWMISKKRYWGLALPIYDCPQCGRFHVVGSLEELKERAVEGWEQFEGHTPHRPHIDAVKIACPHCGATVSRIPDVGNPWLDAGIVSMSTMRYRTDREYWEKWFPADLISESFPGQFRNWFYSLIAMATVMERRAPFRNCFTYATLFAEDGRAMHKSWGNAIEFNEAADLAGVDAMRWLYCTWKPEQNLLFGYHTIDEARRRFLIPWWNVYSFFVTYANLDGWQPDPAAVPQRSLLDRWILSRLQDLVASVTDRFENYAPDEAAAAAERFMDDLTNWYVRRSRRRFWRSEADQDKQAAYDTLYTVLTTLARLLAPCVPFVTEAMYQNLVRSVDPQAPESVHHTAWPQPAPELLDAPLMADMELARQIVALGHAARAGHNLKVRQPLARVLIHAGGRARQLSDELVALITDELNVKALAFVDEASTLVNYRLLPDNKLLGPKFGQRFPAVRRALSEVDPAAAVRRLGGGLPLSLQLPDGEEVELAPGEVLVQTEPAPGLAVAAERGLTVAVDTVVTPELRAEGLAREVIRRVQNLRKEAGFELDDRIVTAYETGDELAQVIAGWSELIAAETLSVALSPGPAEPGMQVGEDRVDGHDLRLGVRRVSQERAE